MHTRNLIALPLFILALGCVLPAQTPCSVQKSLRGTWAFSELGWTVPLYGSEAATPVTVIGAFSIDGSGKMTGSGTTISATGIPGTPIPAGEVLDFDFQGTIKITPDCTGILRYSIQLKGTPGPLPGEFIERFVYSPWTDKIVSMSVKSPLSKPLWIGSYKRIGLYPRAITWPAITD